jgi:predicted HAD superfamily Cof-like phosphohydrolase
MLEVHAEGVMSERDVVRRFYEAMGVPVREKPEIPSEKERLLRCRLLLEEVFEFVHACGFTSNIRMEYVTLTPSHAPDITSMAHENADVRVLTLGTDVQFGFPPAVLEEVMRANMAKLWPDGTAHTNEHGKMLKPPGWTPADVASVLKPRKEYVSTHQCEEECCLPK